MRKTLPVFLMLLTAGAIAFPPMVEAATPIKPHWAQNCIQIFSQETRNYQQQCDQAFVSGPGHWIKNCIQVFNQVFRVYDQECSQAFVSLNAQGHWTKNCIQVFNQSFRVYETKCQQAYILGG